MGIVERSGCYVNHRAVWFRFAGNYGSFAPLLKLEGEMSNAFFKKKTTKKWLPAVVFFVIISLSLLSLFHIQNSNHKVCRARCLAGKVTIANVYADPFFDLASLILKINLFIHFFLRNQKHSNQKKC